MIIAILRSISTLIITGLGIIFPCKLYPFLCKVLLWAINVDIVDIRGNDVDENIPIIFNHPNPFDHIVLMAALKKTTFICCKKRICIWTSSIYWKEIGMYFCGKWKNS